ncbi:MAG: T9SS type A sorting domain-containing protein [Candidatus Cyclobacteriaceae bacterium M2_1C_046]
MKNKNPRSMLMALAIVLGMVFQINAQSIERQSISSYGSSSKVGTVTIQQTVGQPYSTVSYSDQQVTISPGFQQSKFLFTVIQDDRMGKNLQLEIYPNPVVSNLSLLIPEELNGATVQITDVAGKVYLNENISGVGEYNISCHNWPKGLYLISLTDSEKNSYTSKFIINQ